MRLSHADAGACCDWDSRVREEREGERMVGKKRRGMLRSMNHADGKGRQEEEGIITRIGNDM